MPSTADQVDAAGRRSALRADLAAVTAGALLVVAAAAVGRMLLAQGVNLLLPFPPLLAQWLPHAGPGTPVAVVVAVAVVAWGPALAAALPWPHLLAAAWAAAVVWTLGLALVDGWQRGVVERLSSGEEYLHDVPRVDDVAGMLATFADHILTNQPVHWTTHVGAHPPGVLLFYVALDRLGLGGGGPAGVVTVLVGASACVAVAVALRALGAEDVARRALPFGVLLPGAVWVGVSADGMFAAVLAWGVALLAVGATGRGARADAAALAGGVLLGTTLYLSYGLVLGLLLPASVVAVDAAVARRGLRGGGGGGRVRGVHRIRLLVVHRVRPRAGDLRGEHRGEPAVLLLRVGEPRGGVVRGRARRVGRGAPRRRRAPRACRPRPRCSRSRRWPRSSSPT